MYSQHVIVGVPLQLDTARIACWFSKATTHWSNFCTRDGIDSQTVLRTIRESKKKPSVKESKELDQIAVSILLETSSEVKDPAEFLWRHNCIIYSIATDWKKYTRKGKSAAKDKGHKRGENKYVKEMQKLRR